MTGLGVVLFAALLQGEASIARIEIADLKKASDAGQVLIVDVRDPAAYGDAHIAGAVSIPEHELQKNLERLKAEKRAIVTYCA